jgi:hypothetical protein
MALCFALERLHTETEGMAEADLRRLLDYLLEEARQLGPRHVVDGKMTIPSIWLVGDTDSSEKKRSTRYERSTSW